MKTAGPPRLVFSDGQHNAFTDMAEWQGERWLVFRTGWWHGVRYDLPRAERYLGDILVLREGRRSNWEVIQRIRIPDGDCRDPKFYRTADNLFLFVPYRYGTKSTATDKLRVPTRLFRYAPDKGGCFTPSAGQPFEELNWHLVWPWRGGRGPDGAYYVAAHCRRHRDDNDVRIFRSADGFDWKPHSRVISDPHCAEPSLVFDGGRPMVLVRRDPLEGDVGRPGSLALLARADAVDGPWRMTTLNDRIGGPLIFRWHNEWVVAGRRHAGRDTGNRRSWKDCRAAVWVLRADRLDLVFDLPSGGDCSYPGVIQVSGNRCFMSYYSTHERPEHHDELTPRRSCIYLAELVWNAAGGGKGKR